MATPSSTADVTAGYYQGSVGLRGREPDGLFAARRAAMQRRLEEREGVLRQHFEPRAVAPRIRVPTLVVHDRGDRINGFADGQAFAHAIQGAQLLATEGLGHRRILKEAEVIGKVVAFAR